MTMRAGGGTRCLATCLAGGLAAGCGAMPVLQPQGPGAAAITDLWWWLFWMTILPAAGVLTFLLLAVLRRRHATDLDRTSESHNLRLILWVGGVMPLAVILVLMVQSFRTGPRAAEPPQEPALRVRVVGHMFWWEVHYPDHGVVTANEIHVPAGQATQLELQSADVIHSFWIPALHGKLDMIPGRTNVFWVQPDRPGIFRGQCAEFCGTQHALMGLMVVAEEPRAFDEWIAAQQRPVSPAADPILTRGEAVYQEAGCHLCHAVEGRFEPPVANAGPDLTRFGGRHTIGSVTMANTDDNLRDWIDNPHRRKPGVRMPASLLTDDDLTALVAYLRAQR
jgi:cytochrome c oxidase subunit II